MQILFSHIIEKKLKSISERLRYVARDKNAYASHIDHRIKSENLLHNLSLTLSHIILKLQFIERSKEVFGNIIEEYNKDNNTILTFEDFEKTGWIRFVSGEIVMPELVRHFIWQVGYYEEKGNPVEIPTDKNDIVRCL